MCVRYVGISIYRAMHHNCHQKTNDPQLPLSQPDDSFLYSLACRIGPFTLSIERNRSSSCQGWHISGCGCLGGFVEDLATKMRYTKQRNLQRFGQGILLCLQAAPWISVSIYIYIDTYSCIDIHTYPHTWYIGCRKLEVLADVKIRVLQRQRVNYNHGVCSNPVPRLLLPDRKVPHLPWVERQGILHTPHYRPFIEE